jgi:hydroxymethylbilane synthase
MENEVRLTGLVAHPDGKHVIKQTLAGKDEWAVGEKLAKDMKEQGAGQLLATLREGLVG